MCLTFSETPKKGADGMANIVDLEEQSDEGLRCLLRHACQKT